MKKRILIIFFTAVGVFLYSFVAGKGVGYIVILPKVVLQYLQYCLKANSRCF